MGLFDDVTLNIATGNFYLAPVGTVAPKASELSAAIPVAWSNIGHTSVDNILSASSDGGESTTLATLQAKTLRTTTTPRTESWGVTLEQWDVASLKLYFGSNAALNATTGWLDVPGTPSATQNAFLAVFQDGTQRFGIYAPKVEIKRGDDWNIADTTSLQGLPITITPLSHNGADSAFSVTPLVHTP